MKKVIFTLLTATVMYMGVSAQYCGGSGSTVCTPSGTLTKPGLSPPSDSLPPVVNGTAPNTVIQFKNFDTFVFSGQTVTVQSLKIDTLNNLPQGLCWKTNQANNTWTNQQDGCIKIEGLVCDTPGQYKLYIVVTANIGVPITTNADAAGLKYFVRVINSGDATVPVDTLQTAAFAQPNGYSATNTGCNVGIDEIASINGMNVVPNPFNNKAVVTFNAEKSGVMTERITNMLGSEVYSGKLNVVAGSNTSTINRNNLPAGVYFYSITDGKNAVTKRVVITE